MRIRIGGLAVAGLLGLAGVASAQQSPGNLPPVAVPQPMLTAAPPAAAPVQVAPAPLAPAGPGQGVPAPVVVQGQGCSSGCGGVPAALPPVSGGSCKACGRKSVFAGRGTAMPVECASNAAYRTFAFGSCAAFNTPGRKCNGLGIEYGPGGLYNGDRCHTVGTFLER